MYVYMHTHRNIIIFNNDVHTMEQKLPVSHTDICLPTSVNITINMYDVTSILFQNNVRDRGLLAIMISNTGYFKGKDFYILTLMNHTI